MNYKKPTFSSQSWVLKIVTNINVIPHNNNYYVIYLLAINLKIVGGSSEGKLSNGLITGHAYSITGLRKVMFSLFPI